MTTIDALPAGFQSQFFVQTETPDEPKIVKDGMVVHFPAFVRQETRTPEGGGEPTTVYVWFDVPVPYKGQPLTDDRFQYAAYADLRKFFYGTQEMQAELKDDNLWEAHRQAIRTAFPKVPGGVNEQELRWEAVKANFWALVDEACAAVGKTRSDLPDYFNDADMIAFAQENGMSAADIAAYSLKFALVSLDLPANNRNWKELFS